MAILPLTHIQVLQAADAGRLFQTMSPGFLYRSYAVLADRSGRLRGRDVTAVVRKMTVGQDVPLLRVGDPFGPQLRLWYLTDAGRTAIDAETRHVEAGLSRDVPPAVEELAGMVGEVALDGLAAMVDGLVTAGFAIVRSDPRAQTDS